MPAIAQVRRLNYNGEDIGMGFNSDTGLAVGTALDFSPPTGDRPQEAEGSVTIITSHEELMEALHMSAQVEGRYAFSSAGGKVDFAKNTAYNSASTFVVARLVINNAVSRGTNFKLKPDAQRLLDAGQLDTFTKAFGDSFVRAHYDGGEFYAVMRVTSVDSRTETALTTQLHLSLQTGLAGGDFQGALANANKSDKTRSDFFVSYYQKGGSGSAEIGTTLDLDAIKKRLKDFPDAVKNHPFPYYIEVATYDTIPIPLPSKEQQEDFLAALADADEKKLKYLQLRNDCEFAAEHPEFFHDPPPRPALLSAAATFLQLANAAIAHAVNLSNGRIVPPQLFDPSKLTPPVTVPDLQLRKKDVGLEESFADWWVTKDAPATRPDDRRLVGIIFQQALQDLNDFGSIVDPGGDPAKTRRLQGEALARIVAGFTEMSLDGPAGANEHALTSLASLPTMLPASIKSLTAAQNALTMAKGLEQFTALSHLDLSHNQIADIGPLASLTGLRSLLLVDNRVADLSPLRSCASLTEIDLSGNDVTDLTPLASCKALRRLTLAGTVLVANGRTSRSGNPIANATALASLPQLANPFFVGKTLSVRYGDLTQGAAAQFTGTAVRVGDSTRFRVELRRGAEAITDEWVLSRVNDATLADAEDFRLFFPSLRLSDVPTGGLALGIIRASAGARLEVNMSYVAPGDPSRAVIDLTAFPAFGTTIKMPTFDAVVVA